MNLGPLLLQPILKHRAWGGTLLAVMGKRAPAGATPPFGESWELADLPGAGPGGSSIVANGVYAGRTLAEAMALEERAVREHGGLHRIMGRAERSPAGAFPLLVKFLDAQENLSLQVHPGPEAAKRHPGAAPKSEAWVILRAAPGACVYRGIDPALSRDDVAKRLDEDRLLDAVIRIPVRAGDCVRVPSGICHALGAGVAALEVQTPSDTTYRLWDWGRRDPARPLHRDEALECLLVGEAQRLDEIPVVNAEHALALEAAGFRTVRLCRAPELEIEEIARLDGDADGEDDAATRPLDVITEGMPVVWIILEGSVGFAPGTPGDADPILAGPWQTVLVPAACEGWMAHLAHGTRLLRVTLPDRMSRMLAGDG